MFIFDDLVKSIDEINSKYDFQEKRVFLKDKFSEDPNQFIFSKDKAFELGNKPFSGEALELLTDASFEDQILLCGNDLTDIKENSNFARIALASIDKEAMGMENLLYKNIRKFDYVKYHFAYEGAMIKESVFDKKESLVVSRKALEENRLDFSQLGSYMISKYKELPFVKNVKIIFVTSNEYDYQSLGALISKAENITKALDHLVNKVKMDCHSCSLQVICNEVEKKVQEDFKNN